MPGKKKKFNARFPPARIKKIMQSDEDIGKVAAAVPVIISRALELFVETLLKKSKEVATFRRARTLSPSHLKICIHSENRFDFLKEVVNVAAAAEDVHDDTDEQSSTTVLEGGEHISAESSLLHPINSHTTASTSSASTSSDASTRFIILSPREKESSGGGEGRLTPSNPQSGYHQYSSSENSQCSIPPSAFCAPKRKRGRPRKTSIGDRLPKEPKKNKRQSETVANDVAVTATTTTTTTSSNGNLSAATNTIGTIIGQSPPPPPPPPSSSLIRVSKPVSSTQQDYEMVPYMPRESFLSKYNGGGVYDLSNNTVMIQQASGSAAQIGKSVAESHSLTFTPSLGVPCSLGPSVDVDEDYDA